MKGGGELLKKLSEKDYQLFKQICTLEEKTLVRTLSTFLSKRYGEGKVCATEKFVIATGDIPVVLVAHLDTVFDYTPDDIYYDREEGMMWSPQGLGADDRAGVFSILKIIRMGYRPHVIFTTEEEIGGKGASNLISIFPQAPFDFKYMIELDRQGDAECVFYNCDNHTFTDYVESFGFVEKWGTFSDISVIAPAWGKAAVNLSIGYKNEHSYREILNVNSMLLTIKKVVKMLEDAVNVNDFEYIGSLNSFSRFDWLYKDLINGSEETIKCDVCGRDFYDFELVPVKATSGKTEFYCPDCIAENNKVSWCATCYEAFELDSETLEEIECADCRKMR